MFIAYCCITLNGFQWIGQEKHNLMGIQHELSNKDDWKGMVIIEHFLCLTPSFWPLMDCQVRDVGKGLGNFEIG